MKIQLVRKEKLDKANENIELLVDYVIDLHKEINNVYCPYAWNDREKACGEHDGCDECKEEWYDHYRSSLIADYSVKG